MAPESPTILALVGPTASGKSALGLELAERVGGEIVSCDSMQVYRGLDVGTAKPSPAEQARVPHHLIDVVEADQPFTAARYAELADRAIAAIQARGRPPLLVGGTGLYLRAIRFGLAPAPGSDPELRARLYQEERLRPGSLHQRLGEVDPPTAARLDPHDLVRVVRALEVHTLSGTPLSAHHAAHVAAPRYPLRVLVLDPPREVLAVRVRIRTEEMLRAGLLEETRRMIARHGPGLRALGAVGYRQALSSILGELPEAELPEAIARATLRYARRQRTWFNKEPGAERCEDLEQARALLRRWPEA